MVSSKSGHPPHLPENKEAHVVEWEIKGVKNVNNTMQTTDFIWISLYRILRVN